MLFNFITCHGRAQLLIQNIGLLQPLSNLPLYQSLIHWLRGYFCGQRWHGIWSWSRISYICL